MEAAAESGRDVGRKMSKRSRRYSGRLDRLARIQRVLVQSSRVVCVLVGLKR